MPLHATLVSEVRNASAAANTVGVAITGDPHQRVRGIMDPFAAAI